MKQEHLKSATLAALTQHAADLRARIDRDGGDVWARRDLLAINNELAERRKADEPVVLKPLRLNPHLL